MIATWCNWVSVFLALGKGHRWTESHLTAAYEEIPFKHINIYNLRLILPNYRSNYDFVSSNWTLPSAVIDSPYVKKPNNTCFQT